MKNVMEDGYKEALEEIAKAKENRLARISLDGLELKILPPELFELTWLKILWIPNNKITHLPPEIGKLINLTELWLDDYLLLNMPNEIKLTKLKMIYLNKRPLGAKD